MWLIYSVKDANTTTNTVTNCYHKSQYISIEEIGSLREYTHVITYIFMVINMLHKKMSSGSYNEFWTLKWRNNGRDGVSNHQLHDCLLSRLFRHRPKKTSKLHVTGLCEGNSLVTGEFPIQMASDAENVSIWWRHHEYTNSEHKGWCDESYLSVNIIH